MYIVQRGKPEMPRNVSTCASEEDPFANTQQQQISSSLAHYTGFRTYGTKSVLLGYFFSSSEMPRTVSTCASEEDPFANINNNKSQAL
jgi:hypothetical protein